MLNEVDVVCDVENNEILISDGIGLVDECISVLSDFELTLCYTDVEYNKRYKIAADEIISNISNMYIELLEPYIKYNIVSPFEFTLMTDVEFMEHFHMKYQGNGPVALFDVLHNDGSKRSRVAGEATSKLFNDKLSVLEFIVRDRPIIYTAYKNGMGEYRIRYYTNDGGNQILSSDEYKILQFPTIISPIK